MRTLILAFPPRLQVLLVVSITIAVAFLTASLSGMFFDTHQLKINTDLISSVYQVMGTIYAILLTFTLWGVWQSYTDAESAVQHEAFAMMDLVHLVEASPRWLNYRVREAALNYASDVVMQEWQTLKDITSKALSVREQCHISAKRVMQSIQSIMPDGEREVAIFGEVLRMMDQWLDARRKRILIASGNSAKAIWPLLLLGALVLFAFHGLFVAQTEGIWITLLAGTSLVIGLAFYLIFTLDCPFAGSPSVDNEAFSLIVSLLKRDLPLSEKIRVPS